MYNISFQFDETTKKVSKVNVEEIKEKEALIEGSFVSLKENKLEFTKDALDLLEAKSGDKLVVKYFTINNEETFPIIGKVEAFDGEEGNKLTKSRTVSFRGDQKKILLEYGTLFKLVSFKEGIFKLEAQETEDIERAENQAVAEAAGKLDKFVGLMDLNPDKEVPEIKSSDDLPF